MYVHFCIFLTDRFQLAILVATSKIEEKIKEISS